MECWRSMRYMAYFFFLWGKWDSRSLSFKLPFWKCFRLVAPGERGGGLILFVCFSRPFTRAFTIHSGWMEHRLGPTPSSWMLPALYNPTVDKKKTYFLYPLDVHTPKSGYVLFPPHPTPSKKSYLFKDPQNKYFLGSHPPLLPNNNYNINNKPQSS